MTDMDFKFLEDYGIAHLISHEELDNIINHMIETYDRTYNTTRLFFDSPAEVIISLYTKNYNKIFEIIDTKARLDFEEEKANHDNITSEDDESFTYYDISQWEERTLSVSGIRSHIFYRILNDLEPIARERRYDRMDFRIKPGTKINLSDYNHCLFNNVFEFFHDGGWGIVNKDGIVLIGNHLIIQPSKDTPCICESEDNNNYKPFFITKDRDTELYGILSLDPIEEILPCEYREIKVLEKTYNNKTYRAIKVLTQDVLNSFWGCFNDECKQIADFKYDTIEFNQCYLECGRDGDYQWYYHDYDDGHTVKYEGIFDLYNTEGDLLVGGYYQSDFKFTHSKFNIFSFRLEHVMKHWYYERYHIQDYIDEYVLDYPQCLILDDSFTSVILDSSGKKYTPKNEKTDNYPASVFIPGEIVYINDEYIISRIENYDLIIESEYVEPIEWVDIFADKVLNLDNKANEREEGYWKDTFVEESTYLISHIDETGNIDWRSTVDEYWHKYWPSIIRIGSKYGLLNSKGIQLSNFDAISEDFNIPEGRYVAQKVIIDNPDETINNNPNYSNMNHCLLQFYKVNKDGWPERLEDNWDVFDPNNVSWIPKDFLTSMDIYPKSNCDYYDDDYDYYDDGQEHGWSDRDLRDAYMAALEDDLSNEWNFD